MAVAFLCAAFILTARAGPLAVGDTVPAFSANDQFGKEYNFKPGQQFLLVGFDMSASKVANLKLANLGADWLEKHGAAYVLDIHSMPAVARLFALPKMRKYPERIVLVEDEKVLAPFPHKSEKITVLALKPDGKIREIRYWDPRSEPLETLLN